MNYHDHIYPNYEEETVKIIKNSEEFHLLEDSRLEPIIIALRKKPLTIRELEEKYNEIVKDKVDKMDLSQKQKEILQNKLERKSKTLYKYINILEENGFVIQAGKRIVENQTATETMYGRTAKLFLFQGELEDWGSKEDTQAALDLLSKLLGLLNNKSNPSTSYLGDFFEKIESKINGEVEELITKFSKELPQIAEKTDYSQLTIVLYGLKTILLLKNYLNFEDELKKENVI